MKIKENYKIDEVYQILKNFVKDEIHEGDFSQGQDLKQTISILDKWWNKKFKSSRNNSKLQFSEKDIELIVGYIIYGFGMTAGAEMVKEDFWNKYINKNEEIPKNITEDIGKTINSCLIELQEEGRVLQ